MGELSCFGAAQVSFLFPISGQKPFLEDDDKERNRLCGRMRWPDIRLRVQMESGKSGECQMPESVCRSISPRQLALHFTGELRRIHHGSDLTCRPNGQFGNRGDQSNCSTSQKESRPRMRTAFCCLVRGEAPCQRILTPVCGGGERERSDRQASAVWKSTQA